MVALTPKLSLEILSASQSQKHVTVNDDVRILDVLVQATCINQTTNTPPGSPADGDTYIVGSSPTGAWSGQALKIAYYNSNAWQFFTAKTGWIVYDVALGSYVQWSGSAWVGFPNISSNVAQLGINTSPSGTNKLAVASSSILFTNIGNNVQIFLNKNAAGDTASTLYETGFSGRAEVGLTGDDNFHFKVSPNGSSYTEALILDKTTGVATMQDILLKNNCQVTSDFSATSNIVLANVTGLVTSQNLVAGATYGFEAILYTTSNVAAGIQAAINASSAPTFLRVEAISYDTAAIKTQTRTTTNGAACVAVTAVTVALVRITGTIVVNAACTLAVQFAQNVSNAAASKVLQGSEMTITRLS